MTLPRMNHDPAPSVKRGLVWIVDDSPLEAEMAQRALSFRYDIELFADGATMLERLASEAAPDTLVLDWHLPGMSGVEVCRFLRGTWDEVALPVLMLTVHGHKEDVVEGLAAGANDYVTKPYDAAELLARVGTLVRIKRLHERTRRAEQACVVERLRLTESEARLRTISEAIPQIVWTATADGTVDYVNQRWLEHTGVTLEQLRARGWHSVLHPDDRESCLATWNHSLATGAVYDIQLRLFHAADGEYHWHLGRALPLRDTSGRITQWFGTFTDIDDRKRTERALDLLARAGTALDGSVDSKGRCENIARLLVPALADAAGAFLCDQDEMIQLVAGAHAPPAEAGLLGDLAAAARLLREGSAGDDGLRKSRPILVPDVAAALACGAPGEAAPLEALRAAGVTACIFAPLALQGRSFGYLALAIAGSGRRYDEADLALAEELGRRMAVAIDNARLFEMTQNERARVEEANQAKDEFLAIVSHELRSPLTAILGWTSLLREGKLSEESSARAVQTIERNAKSQAQLIHDLLNISSIISGKLRLNLGPVQPAAIVEAGIEAIRPAGEAKGVLLKSSIAAHMGVIQGDPERLQQIIWNLLTNAVKFTPKGGQIEVRAQRVTSEVEVSVADTGSGISPAFLPHVFERFRQAEGGVTRQHGGLGLGLAITRHLVELHGGTIEARSRGQGLGATFVFRLPVMAPSAAPAVEHQRAADATALPELCPPELEGLRVLLVDDEEDVRAFMTSVMIACKASVRAVATAADALEAIRQEPPDVLVSDIGMPGESGYDLIRKVRHLTPEQGGRVPALALTGYARLEDRTRALMMGFDMHISKPIEMSELLVVIARLASRRS